MAYRIRRLMFSNVIFEVAFYSNETQAEGRVWDLEVPLSAMARGRFKRERLGKAACAESKLGCAGAEGDFASVCTFPTEIDTAGLG